MMTNSKKGLKSGLRAVALLATVGASAVMAAGATPARGTDQGVPTGQVFMVHKDTSGGSCGCDTGNGGRGGRGGDRGGRGGSGDDGGSVSGGNTVTGDNISGGDTVSGGDTIGNGNVTGDVFNGDGNVTGDNILGAVL